MDIGLGLRCRLDSLQGEPVRRVRQHAAAPLATVYDLQEPVPHAAGVASKRTSLTVGVWLLKLRRAMAAEIPPSMLRPPCCEASLSTASKPCTPDFFAAQIMTTETLRSTLSRCTVPSIITRALLGCPPNRS